ncbi:MULTISPECIES: fimbrial protein [Providencia]|uniref:fimbrial protein n=1 Tax=Providencia TaxID=586 RepID=UPI0015EBB430|nr:MULTISPECIES: fimbrial protein [Providencia]ELR5139732.1 type 1 fimbrial protein [Providencia rettgeri]ELR5169639.1 type 1 fimbrial protein [Providencia rettgeri]QLQ94170.1 type 1 fimbrial protein [Providencia rettgeri]WEB84752.1 type 1 fimbrial protein [Providencia rettgeri]HCH7936792.1 type 1 fimbrial protein [Providencia rettgeri]
MKKINQLLLIGFFSFTASHIVVAATNNVKIKGRLVNSPCVVLPENKNVEVDFGDIRLLDIYDPTYQLPRREMTLTLSNCDLSIAKRMKVKISGAEHGQMPGFIALTGVESNPGLGIGFKLSSGEEIKINQVSPLIPITQSGKNELKFDTFLKATPDSIANQQIKTGHISAIATFLFEYE